jgi:hypothetical protein
MNRRPVGSSVGSSGERVCALSCSLLEYFLPSDEPTPTCFTPSVHPVLKEFSSFHRPARNYSDASIFKSSNHPMVGFTQEQNCTDGSTDAIDFLLLIHPTLYKSVGPVCHNSSAGDSINP